MSDWNDWRAATAGEAVALFARLSGGDIAAERADMVGDLLCNLGHYCNKHGLDWEALIAQGRDNFAFERVYGDEEYGSEKPPAPRARYVYLVWDRSCGDNDLMGIFTTQDGAKAKVVDLTDDEDNLLGGPYKIEVHPLSEEAGDEPI